MLNIRSEREKKGWTLAEVSKRTGIAAPDLSRLEQGKIPAYPSWRRRLSRLFQQPADLLFAPVEGKGESVNG
jgi:transcriptional regulator with XRE-family HTH domain